MTETGTPVLSAVGLAAGPGRQPTVEGIDLQVNAGEVLALLGPNGSGKSTVVRAVAGDLEPVAGEVTGGPAGRTVAWIDGAATLPTARKVKHHLRLGRCTPAAACAMFPELVPLLGRRLSQLTPGEQRLLTVARALAPGPAAVLADELSTGVDPVSADRLLDALRAAADRGAAVLVVEQFARKALRVADHVIVLRGGRVAFRGPADEARRSVAVIEAGYLTAS